MMSLGELEISFPLFFYSKNSSNDITSGNVSSEKLIKMRFFTMKIYYVPSENDPNVSHTKNQLGLVAIIPHLTFSSLRMTRGRMIITRTFHTCLTSLIPEISRRTFLQIHK